MTEISTPVRATAPAPATPTEPPTAPVRAALRDASWFARPRRGGKPLVYHVVLGEPKDNSGACGGLVVATSGSFDECDQTVAADTVELAFRCGKPGCRARWPAYAGG